MPGVAGWKLDESGTAEFSQIILHGSKIIKGGMLDDGVVLRPNIGTGAVGYPALNVGTGNLAPDPSFEGAFAQTLVSTGWTIDPTGRNSGKSLRSTVTTTTTTRGKTITKLPVMPGEKYYLAFDYQTSANWTGTAVKFYLLYRDAAGRQRGVRCGAGRSYTGATWKRVDALVTVPTNARNGGSHLRAQRHVDSRLHLVGQRGDSYRRGGRCDRRRHHHRRHAVGDRDRR
ncbi:hypothetical protein E4K10_49885 [Streptomyces sp. T1317-0309]|nr:hypothetical protein E4K10_49885 [Streptomyces sp. T1317-0309]